MAIDRTRLKAQVMTRIDRRIALRAILGSLLVAACGDRQSSSIRIMTSRPSEISPDEFALLTDPARRAAAHGDGPLTITGRLFGPPHALDGQHLENVHFVDCDFFSHEMRDVNLTHVSFTRCVLSQARWLNGNWTDVTFVECVGRGQETNLLAGAGQGEVVYRDCDFMGGEPTGSDRPDANHLFGAIGGAGRCRFEHCELTRMTVNVIGSADFSDCRFLGVSIDQPKPEQPLETLRLTRCSAKSMLYLCNYNLKTLSISDCDFQGVDLNDVKARSVTLSKVRGNFDALRLTTESLAVADCVFKTRTFEQDIADTGGFRGRFVTLGTTSFDRCSFEGPGATLALSGGAKSVVKDGKKTPLVDEQGQPVADRAEVGALSLRQMQLPDADLSYLQVPKLTFEDCTVTGLRLDHDVIGTLTLTHTALDQTVDCSDTVVEQVAAQTLTRGPKLKLLKTDRTRLSL